MRRGAIGYVALVLALSCAGCSGSRIGDTHTVGPPSLSSSPRAALLPPKPFLVDLTWVSDLHGWALSASPCAKDLCAQVATTTDGGLTWKMLAAPRAFVDNDQGTCAPCVGHIRFATPAIGYLFGPALFVTMDGGRTWSREAAPPVESLAPAPGSVLRLVYDRSGCPGPCDRSLQEAALGSGTWRTLRSVGGGVSAQIVRQGTQDVYIPIFGNLASGAGAQHATILRSLDAGSTWTTLPDPCGGSGQHIFDAIALAAAPGGIVDALCAPRGGEFHNRFVLVSADAGSDWSSRHPVIGSAQMIAVASATNIVVANSPISGNGGYLFQLADSSDGGRRWTTAISTRETLNPATPEAAFLGFEDARVGRWVGDGRTVWMTHDGGIAWIRRSFP
jgi:photosystem II stability/assembly factor-like uncharacterized protein